MSPPTLAIVGLMKPLDRKLRAEWTRPVDEEAAYQQRPRRKSTPE